MIKNKYSHVSISYRNVTHYQKLGYNALIGSDLEILTEHLPTSSHVKVEVICEICLSETQLIYHKYIENKKRHGFYSCKSCSRHKAALTSIEKYGVDNYSKTEEYIKRVEKTNIEKYGYKTNLISPVYQKDIKEKLKSLYGKENFYEINRSNRKRKKRFILNEKISELKSYIMFSENLYNEEITKDTYHKYRNEVRRITNSNINKLYENWNGIDFYDGQDISNNFNYGHNDPKYPTIDHKKSIYWGFCNQIDPKVIGDIENLCITKRSINSSKRDKNVIEYQIYIPILFKLISLH